MGGIEHRQVRLRRRPHIFQGMEETKTGLCHLGAPIHTDTTHIQGSPYRITGKQLVIGFNTGEFYHTKLHGHMIHQLLCFLLRQSAICQISLNINIQESRDTSHTHSCAVLCLDSG